MTYPHFPDTWGLLSMGLALERFHDTKKKKEKRRRLGMAENLLYFHVMCLVLVLIGS